MNKKILLKFISVELFNLLLNILFYNILTNVVTSFVAFLISTCLVLAIGYILYLKFIFKQKFQLKDFIIYSIIQIILILLKNLCLNIFIYQINSSVFIAKFISTSLFFVLSFVFKIAVFNTKKSDFAKRVKENIQYINNGWEKFLDKRIIKKVFMFLPKQLPLFVLFLFSIYFIIIFGMSNNDVILYSQNVSDGNIGTMINESIEIDFQKIKVDGDVNKICIPFGTYQRKNDSILNFKLYNEQNKVLLNKTINTEILEDGKPYCLHTDLISKDNLKDYRLEITASENDKNNSVTVFKNNKTKEYTITLKKISGLMSAKGLIMLIFIILYFAINYIINKKSNKLSEHHYFIILLLYIFPALFIYPPFEVPDEPVHFYNAYNLSQNLLESDKVTNLNTPKNIECLNYAGIQNRDMVVDNKYILKCLKSTENIKASQFFGVNSTVGNSFMGYLFSSFGIKLIDLFSNSPLIIFYAGRLFNFLFSALIIYKAIKIVPCHKKSFLFIATIPMFIQQMVSYSYDSVLNSICLFFVAYVLRIIYNRLEVKLKDKIIVSLLLLFILSIKLIYLPIAVLLLFIPKCCFKNKQEKWILIIFIILFLLVSRFAINEFLFSNQNGLVDNSGNLQIEYILHNPLKLLTIIKNTIICNSKVYLQGIFGYFSWFKFHLNDIIIYLYTLYFIYIIASERNILASSQQFKYRKNKFLIVIALFIMIAAVFGSMYITWSSYKLNYVDGVQGRYFLPLLPLIVLLLAPTKNKILITNANLYTFINIMLVHYLLSLIIYFY